MKYTPEMPSFDPYEDVIEGSVKNTDPFAVNSEVLRQSHQERQSRALRTTVAPAIAYEALQQVASTVVTPKDPFKRDRARLRSPE